ncbi:DEAD/DEAH box helicase [Ruminococcus sp.]
MRFKKAELDVRTRYIADLEKRLTTYFKDYRNEQKSIIESLLKGHDTVVRLRTGGGKSLCFQAPAIISQGVTIVISPLQALCNDQVDNFNKKYCTKAVTEFNKKYMEAHPECAGFLSDKMPKAEFDLSVSKLVKNINDDNTECKLLYLSPEMLNKPVYRQELIEAAASGKLKISMIILDEAHCLSEWGFNFRESYFQICSTIARLKKYQEIPMGVFSASLTPANAEQLKVLLDMKKTKEFGICTDRSADMGESSLSVKRDDLNVFILNCDKSNLDNDKDLPKLYYLLVLLNNISFKKCIVYCNTVKQVEYISKRISKNLAKKGGKLSKGSISYHGKMYHSARLGAEYKYASKELGYNIIVATMAFGMGIDNSDVDLVIHYAIPESIETYYQEIGRAGRSAEDRNNNVIMLYKNEDNSKIEKGKEKEETENQEEKKENDTAQDKNEEAPEVEKDKEKEETASQEEKKENDTVQDKNEEAPEVEKDKEKEETENQEEKKENDKAQDKNEVRKRRLVRIETKRRYVYTVNNVFSESSVISRLDDRTKGAFKLSRRYSFDMMKRYVMENLERQPITKEQAVECLGKKMQKCYDKMALIPCDQTVIDEYFNGTELENIIYEYIRNSIMRAEVPKKKLLLQQVKPKKQTSKITSVYEVNEDLRRVIGQINELYINNTLLANEIRNFNWFYKPDENGTVCNKGNVIAERVFLEAEGRNIEGFRFYDRSTEWKKELAGEFLLERHVFNDSAFIYIRPATLSGKKEFEIRYHAQKILMEDLKSQREEYSLRYVYFYTDVNRGGASKGRQRFDLVITAAYKIDRDIFDGIISGDKDSADKDFLQILGYTQGDKYDIRLGFDKWETDRLIRKYKRENDDLSEIKEDERAVSYIDKKINRLLGEKEIQGLYDGLSGKRKDQEDYNYRVAFVKGQRRNDICCTLWYQDSTSYEKAPLTYFDMCVFDAVCTIWNNNRKEFYLNTIWELLSGNEDIRFSRNALKDKLRESVEKLQRLRIFIASTENAPQKVSDGIWERFINVQRGEDSSGREVYEIKSCPRLWTYAVGTQEGQIARVPLYKLDGRRYFKLDSGQDGFDCSNISALCDLLNDPDERIKIIRRMKKESILDPEYKCSIWKVVLHFYLAHRLSIIKRKNKMRFISYDTIVKLMEDYLPESLKNGKKKELLRQWSFCYMTWATLPRQEYHWWVCEEYFDEKTDSPAGIVVKRKKLERWGN